MVRDFHPHLFYHQKVRVYRNLNNGLVSVQHKGKVVGHTDNLAMPSAVRVATFAGVRLIVSECLRVQMVAARRRKVHAYAEGILLPYSPDIPLTHTLHYNPYRSGYFTSSPGETIVESAGFVVVKENVVYVTPPVIQQLSLF